MMPPDTTASAVMVLEWAMTAGAAVRLAADEMASVAVSTKPPQAISDFLRDINVRVQLATWMDGAAARWPTLWGRAGRLPRTWMTWRGSQRVHFTAAEISEHCKRIDERRSVGDESAELADFLAVGDIVERRDVIVRRAENEARLTADSHVVGSRAKLRRERSPKFSQAPRARTRA